LPARRASPALLAELARGTWPGNVRELRNGAERFALGLEQTTLGPETDDSPAPLADQMATHERKILVDALIRHKGALKPVYKALGLSRKALYDKLQKYGIDKAHFQTDDSDPE
jgi:two-component system C4-dicarboxylate transport response regulator DctD